MEKVCCRVMVCVVPQRVPLRMESVYTVVECVAAVLPVCSLDRSLHSSCLCTLGTVRDRLTPQVRDLKVHL